MAPAMIPTLWLLLASVGAQPVRVQLERSGGSLLVHVETTVDGYLTVLRRDANGTVRVLFPADPARSGYLRAGSYDLRAVAEDQAGTIVAAVSPDALHCAEFVRGSRWDGASLAAVWAGGGGESVLTDIVQRMLGDGSFNYDWATYEGASEQISLPGPCADCSFLPPEGLPIGVDTLQCDPFLVDCFPFIHLHRRELARAASAAAPRPGPTLGAYARGRPAGAVTPRGLAGGAPVAAPAPPAELHQVVNLPPLVIVQSRHRRREETVPEPRARSARVGAGTIPQGAVETPPASTPAFAYVGGAVPRPIAKVGAEKETPHAIAVTRTTGYGVGNVRLIEVHR